MSFRAIACDYDRTLADDGRVAPETVDILRRGRASGLTMILITGRALDDLQKVFSELPLFELVIAENGALLFDPSNGSEKPLCDPPPPAFLQALRKQGVPFAVGRRVVATVQPHDKEVSDLIERMELNMQITLNRESVMVLPAGVDKGTGLTAALAKLGLGPAQVIGIGDAENDVAFLRLCGVSVAVANAIESLKQQVDVVTRDNSGAGVTEVFEHLIAGVDFP